MPFFFLKNLFEFEIPAMVETHFRPKGESNKVRSITISFIIVIYTFSLGKKLHSVMFAVVCAHRYIYILCIIRKKRF